MKASLTRGQVVAGLLAGLFGGLLVAIGWYSFGLLLVVGLVVIVIGTLLSLLLGGSNPIELLGDGADSAGAFVVGAVVVAILVGAGVLFVGVLVSRAILRRGQVRRPLAVTIRAALIAAGLESILFAIAASKVFETSDADRVGPFVVAGLILLIGTLVIAPLVWLWMTWAHRGPAAALPAAVEPGYTAAPAQPTSGITPPPTVAPSDGPPPSIPRG